MHLRVPLAVVALVLVAATPAAAKQRPITGSAPKGYTVIALDDSGRTATALAKPSFKVLPTAKTVTLSLRDARGKFAGPVVAGGKGSKVVLGVKAGAALGKLRVRKGFARPSKAVAKRSLNAKRTARAKKGVPVGAGRLGLVAGSPSGTAGPGRDLDRDGIAGAFDVDDDGDLVLDNVDRTQARAAAVSAADAVPFWVINAGLEVSYISDDKGITQGAAGYALNQNAAGPFANDADFERLRDLVMKDRGELFFRIDPADPSELDCGGLSYCKAGGTGFFHDRMRPFPAQFDSDGDGLGSMEPAGAFAEGQNGLGTMQRFSPAAVFGLAPLAGSADIGSGNTFIQRFASGTAETLALNTVFGTLPALASWGDGTTTTTIGYPVPRGAPGSESNAFEVDKSASGDYVVTFSVWRPQRRPIPGSAEPAGWIDMGGLTYRVVGKTVEQDRRLWNCPADAYGASGEGAPGDNGVIDSAPARPVDPNNKLTFSVNLSACMRASGLGDWKPGDVPSDVFITALSSSGDAAEGGGFAFKPKTGGASSDQFTGTWRFPSGSPEATATYTITANGTAETSHFGIIAYPPRAITGGSTPAGWTCNLGSAGPNPMWECTGGTIRPGAPVSGSITLNQPGQDNMPLDMTICDASNVCKGFGMTQQK